MRDAPHPPDGLPQAEASEYERGLPSAAWRGLRPHRTESTDGWQATDMTIQELGSLGEFVAAVATLATLVYLARQIRANTTAVQAESRRSATSQGMHFQGIIGENKDAASVLRRGLAEPESLDPDEAVQFAFLFSMLASHGDNIFVDYGFGIVGNGIMESTISSHMRLISTPGGRQYWRSHAFGHTPEFRAYVDKRLRDTSA